MARKKKKRRSTLRQPVETGRVRLWRAGELVRLILILAAVGVGVICMILYGFPLIEDLVKGVDPKLRYMPTVEADFALPQEEEERAPLEPTELYLPEFRVKNDPYIDGNRLVFTTQYAEASSFQLDGVVLYNTDTQEAQVLPIQKEYDNLMSPVLSGNILILIDSRLDGGGRIIGYDLEREEQFLVKEYAYAIPELSVAGDILAFVQWAGDESQRLYVYNIKTREAVTLKLFLTRTGNSAVDVSQTDLVWAEYDSVGNGILKRMVFDDGTARYDHYDFGVRVFEPRTNGTDIVFATQKDIISGSLMLSTSGGQPVKIADGVLNYDIGDGYVIYTKDDKVHIHYTNSQDAEVLTADSAQQFVASANGKGFCYYDITDANLLDEVVIYAYAE